MAKHLVIVESPNKCSTINKYLGNDFRVLASFGHITAIPSKAGMVDTNTFTATYYVSPASKKHLEAILDEARKADVIYLCTDPDREGEAISWHLKDQLEKKKVNKPFKRVTFHEITQHAVTDAFKSPRDIDYNLVDAQKARQNLDYLVGFGISPILWNKVAKHTSAGRVQSPALRLVDTRDTEINNFKPDEYWLIKLKTAKDNQQFYASLSQLKGHKGKLELKDKASADKVIALCGTGEGIVKDVKVKETKRNPKPPFRTSTLQQDGIRRLGWSADMVMSTAQKLFEAGLITYMRTDSIVLSKEATEEVRGIIRNQYGNEYCHPSVRVYSSKTANAQEAHEAIRPSHFDQSPSDVGNRLGSDCEKLYSMIYKRTLASQMATATFNSTRVEIEVGDGIFKVTGSVPIFLGYLSVYEEATDVDAEKEDNQKLPYLVIGDKLPNLGINGEQHFTKPPAKFNEATLVSTLEKYGIGRPSTYATIIKTLLTREYVKIDNKRMSITDKGHAVIKYLEAKFPTYVDYQFTGEMENKLDDISNGKIPYLKVMKDFYIPFKANLDREKQSKQREPIEVLDEMCPQCGKHHLQIIPGRYGNYIACSGYPECKYSRPIKKEKPKVEEIPGSKCPKCGHPLVKRISKKGKEFIGCSNYPTCNYIEGKIEPKDTGRICPKCKKHHLVERINRYGKPFISCSGFPKCRYIENVKQDDE